MKPINKPFTFYGKTILLISPQIWSEMRVSKHHYAIELAERGNRVYFLDPLSRGFGYSIDKLEENENLFLIKLRLTIAYHLHFRWLFDLFLKLVFIYISARNKIRFDVVWNFSHLMITDYKVFGSKINIFQPMDATNYKYEFKLAKNSDIVISVSNDILNKFCSVETQKLLINHGLGKDFEKYALEIKKNLTIYIRPSRLTIGFVGNLRFPGLDFQSYCTVIENHPDCDFVFWGSYKKSNSPLGGGEAHEKIDSFVDYLQTKPNVVLKGIVSPSTLAKEIQNVDIFTAFYDENLHLNRSANSHKLLEYLSTGKVIVANYISMYAATKDLIRMPSSNANSALPQLFLETVESIEFFNNKDNMLIRINYALENTYQMQITKIENVISDKISNH